MQFSHINAYRERKMYNLYWESTDTNEYFKFDHIFFSLSRFYAGPTAIIVIHYSDDSITQYLRMKNKFQLKSIYVLFTNGY